MADCASVTLPTAAVLAHWRPAWRDLDWHAAVRKVWTEEPARMAGLAASIREAGVREPVVLGTDGRVWDGHHRLAVACDLALPSIPVAFAALTGSAGCPLCGLPETVHHLWCPRRPGPSETADDVLRRVHGVFADPSRAWFAEQFWTAYGTTPKAEQESGRG